MIKLNGIEIESGNFPDGTLLMKYNDSKYNINMQNVYFPVITWLYQNDAELFKLICLVKHLRNKGIKTIDLEMPYIPNARQDRVKSEEDIFTLKYFCEIINSLNFNQVRVCNAHSNVSLALLNNVKEISIECDLNNIITVLEQNGVENKIDVIFFPDEGACKRYSEMNLGKEIAFGIKKRDWKTGKILGLDVITDIDMKHKNVLIIDDICSYGGTFYHSAKKLKELGANHIYLYITHCENSILKGDLIKSGLIDKIFTTNSIFTETHPLITVIKAF